MEHIELNMQSQSRRIEVFSCKTYFIYYFLKKKKNCPIVFFYINNLIYSKSKNMQSAKINCNPTDVKLAVFVCLIQLRAHFMIYLHVLHLHDPAPTWKVSRHGVSVLVGARLVSTIISAWFEGSIIQSCDPLSPSPLTSSRAVTEAHRLSESLSKAVLWWCFWVNTVAMNCC